MKAVSTRKPIAAGTLYPSDPEVLKAQVTEILNRVKTPAAESPKLIVVPQGSFKDCADLYAEAYSTVVGKHVDTVVLVAYSETEFFNFISIFSGDDYHSPLGSVKIDYLMRDEFADEDDDIFVSDKGHFNKDSFIELQLPFLQVALEPGFKILPIVIGNQSKEFCDELSNAMGEILPSRNVLIVICADMISDPTHPVDEISVLIEDLKVELLEHKTDHFFSRDLKNKFQSGAFGPLHIAAKVSQMINYKTLHILKTQTELEKWDNGDHQVTYFSMAYTRTPKVRQS
ncbi:MAG: AmmeMemoRadiSam system protein B [Bacteroidetes bacterium]|nr:AmmeMemoRadiSam system protein B [Bacteroidota bacterium]